YYLFWQSHRLLLLVSFLITLSHLSEFRTLYELVTYRDARFFLLNLFKIFVSPNTWSNNVDLYARNRYTIPPTTIPIANITIFALLLVSSGNTNPPNCFVSSITPNITKLKITTNNERFAVCL